MAADNGYLLPATVEPPGRKCLQLLIPDEPAYIAAIVGQLTMLGKWWMWASDNSHTGTDCAQFMRDILDSLEIIDGDCVTGLTDIRIENCILQKLVGGVWVNVGSIDQFTASVHETLPGTPISVDKTDCHLTFNLAPGADGADGLPGPPGADGLPGPAGADGLPGADGQDCECDPNTPYLPPEVTEDDRLCNAAHALAVRWADHLQDVMELLDASETITGETIENFLGAVGGVFPWLVPVLESAVEFIHEGVIEVAIDFVRVNCTDIQAVTLAQNKLYCAMKEEGGLEAFWNEIDWLDALPPLSTVFSPALAQWDNFGEWIDYLYSLASGQQVGWFILAYGRFETLVIDHLAGTEDSSTALAAYAYHTASLRDSVMCDECPPPADESLLHLGGDGLHDLILLPYDEDYDDTTYDAVNDWTVGAFLSTQKRAERFRWTSYVAGDYRLTYTIAHHSTRSGNAHLYIWHNENLIVDSQLAPDSEFTDHRDVTLVEGDTIEVAHYANCSTDDSAFAVCKKFDLIPL